MEPEWPLRSIAAADAVKPRLAVRLEIQLPCVLAWGDTNMFHARGVLLAIPFVVACGSKWSFEDGDGDGLSAAEGDCWDSKEGPEGSGLSGSDIGPDAEETWYDGFDQNCDGKDDYDQDGDGFVPSAYAGLTTAGVPGSGSLPDKDCWDLVDGPEGSGLLGSDIWPDTDDAKVVDTWYDGVDQNCDGEDDFDQDGDKYVRVEDQDGDGFFSEEEIEAGEGLVTILGYIDGEIVESVSEFPGGDCNDGPDAAMGYFVDAEVTIKSPQINPGASETWYDGIDQDCSRKKEDDPTDYDQDGDGFDSANYPQLDGETFGDDCYEGDSIDVLGLEAKLFRMRSEDNVTDEKILEYYGMTPMDINVGVDDEPYDGVDADCSGVSLDEWDDCDVDGDGYSLVQAQNPQCEEWLADLNASAGASSDEWGAYEALCNTGNACDESCGDFEEIRECTQNDCDDTDPIRYPDDSIEEIPFDALDNDCNSFTGDGDRDGDGYWDINYASEIEATPELGRPPLEVPAGFDGDCNDGDLTQNPDPETDEIWYDGIDQNCDAQDDYDQDRDHYVPSGYEGEITWYVLDEVPAPVEEGWQWGGNDCNDEDDSAGIGYEVNPGVNEDCLTDYDDDCDGDTNDEDPEGGIQFYADADDDDYGDPDDSRWYCEVRGIYNERDNDDCDDDSETTYPGAASLDSEEDCLKDDDGDERGDVDPDNPDVDEGTDCDDSDPEVTPDAPTERCDTEYDDDCDGDTNDRDPADGTLFYADADGDDYGDPDDSRWYCEERGIYNELNSEDCDDTRAAVNPSVNEDCATSYDDDCDGDTNDEDPEGGTLFYADADADDFGDPDDSRWYCEESGIYNELDDDDCDDTRALVNPDMNENCLTEYDDDCDGDTNDEDPDFGTRYYADVDGDDYGDPDDSRVYCDPLGIYNETDDDDCDDGRAAVNPSVNEDCATSYDDDCDGDTNDEDPEGGTLFYADADADDFGDPADSRWYCEVSGIYNELDDDDCDDTRELVNPDMNENCLTGYDDDCDGDTNDLDPDFGTRYYADVDADDYGDPGDSRLYCDPLGIYNETDSDDCDDTRELVNPDMNENCLTGYDDDCDGDTNDEDPDGGTLFYADVDTDGYGDPGDSRWYCVASGIYTETDDDDCDDTLAAVNPSVNENCATSYDDDCDGDTNDEDPAGGTEFYADVDADGWGDAGDSRFYCEPSGIYNETDDLDCNDDDDTIFPGATESCDLIDSDCDDSLLDGGQPDADGDGDPDCVDDDDGDGFTDTDDCDDTRPAVNPDANENCATPYDDDCDGDTNDEDPDGGTLFYADADADGYGDPDDSRSYCVASGIYNETDDDDCDDTRSAVNPSVNEKCSTTYDDDCDGDTNDEDPTGGTLFYADSDADGYGDPDDSRSYCVASGIYNELDDDDCDDTRSAVNPAADEDCSTSYDDDCDGDTDDEDAVGAVVYYADSDADGYGDPADSILSCSASGIYNELDDDDCDDTRAAVNPSENEDCATSYDDDCDGDTNDEDPDGGTEFFVDLDDDGYGISGDSRFYCEASGLYTATEDEDCDDDDDTIHPDQSDTSAREGVDEDCDKFIDEDTVLDELDSGSVLVFSEMQVNPHAIGNERTNEWFELVNVSGEALYLDNWTFTNCKTGSFCTDFVVSPDKGLSVEPGEVLLFCFYSPTMDALLGSGSCDYSYGLDSSVGTLYRDVNFRLRNTQPSALTVSMGKDESDTDIIIDEVDHQDGDPGAFPSTADFREGFSLMFDSDAFTDPDADVLNDDGDYWCHMEDTAYIYQTVAGEDNYGSPGELNPACP